MLPALQRQVAAEYQKLIREFGGIAALAHGEMFEFTQREPGPTGI